MPGRRGDKGVFAKRTHRMSLADLRENYGLGELSEQNCETNRMVHFEHWIQDAQRADFDD
jgi:pyridoxine/pyridoxamine 5'-phosphate oxidase